MSEKVCPSCGTVFTPLRGDATYCSQRCQKRAARARAKARPADVMAPAVEGEHYARTLDELTAHGGRHLTVLGGVALDLAAQLDRPDLSANQRVQTAAALRAALREALAGAARTDAPDVLDVLRERRERRRAW